MAGTATIRSDIGTGGAGMDKFSRGGGLKAIFTSIIADLAEIKTQFDAHTHHASGTGSSTVYSSPPRTNAATITLGTPRAITIGTVMES